jgi:hypothetical protein
VSNLDSSTVKTSGDQGISGTKTFYDIIQYSGSRTFSYGNQIVDKDYADSH